MPFSRPGKSCKLSSSEKFRILQCPLNSVREREKHVYQMLALQPQFLFLNPQFSILLSQIFFIQPRLSIVYSSSSILNKKCRIFDSNVLKIVEFPAKCLQAPLAQLAAFSRSGPQINTMGGIKANLQIILAFLVS